MQMFALGKYLHTFEKKYMEFISTRGLTRENAPLGIVLVQYLKQTVTPFEAARYFAAFDLGCYEPDRGGWRLANSEKPALVLAYAELPDIVPSFFEGMKVSEFEKRHGAFPNLGSIGE